MLLVIQWIGIRQAMGGGKKEMRATEKQKGKGKCPLGKWLEKKKEKCWAKKKKCDKEEKKEEVDEVRVEQDKEEVKEVRVEENKEDVEEETIGENKEDVEEETMEENKEEVKEETIGENKEEVEKEPVRGPLMKDMDYLGNIEDYLTVAVYEMCGCEECEGSRGGCMIM